MQEIAYAISLIVAMFVLGTAPAIEQTTLPATVIMDASEFIDEIPKDDTIASARSLNAEWIFNNFALRLGSNVNVFTQVSIICSILPATVPMRSSQYGVEHSGYMAASQPNEVTQWSGMIRRI